MNSIDRRNRFALCALVFALSIAVGAAAKTPDSTSANPAPAAATPTSPAPAVNPPAAPEDPAPPPPPATAAQPPSAAQPPTANAASNQPTMPGDSGQWVYTSQYGWVWMPYAARYTSVSADGEVAYMYLYEPAFGWRWVSAPWVLGWGPRPLWGAYGPVHFAWYAHPWFRVGFVHSGPWHAHGWHHR